MFDFLKVHSVFNILVLNVVPLSDHNQGAVFACRQRSLDAHILVNITLDKLVSDYGTHSHSGCL